MAALTSIIAAASLAVAAAGTVGSIVAQDRARSAANQQADAMRNAQAEQKAQMAQQAAEQQRQQVREQRVRQARIMQSAANTGASYSSGEIGAVGATSTNLSDNLGSIVGGVQRASAIGDYHQQASDFGLASQRWSNRSGLFNQAANVGGTIFGAAGGFGALSNANATASRYGTVPGSQQTSMLAAQDSGLI